jgi:ribosome-binding factor A
MAKGYRPDRVGDQLRAELGTLLAREVHDPGIGFITLTRVNVSPDLQSARVYYTIIGDDRARLGTAQALERVAPFLRRELGRRLRLKRAPRLVFVFDESVGGQDRIERLLQELHTSETEVDKREEDDGGESER